MTKKSKDKAIIIYCDVICGRQLVNFRFANGQETFSFVSKTIPKNDNGRKI